MDISKEMLECKNQELALRLASAAVEDRPMLLEKLNALASLQRSYEKVCAQYEAMFVAESSFVEIEITDGALSENYLNLSKAVSAGLVKTDRPVRISFPGLQIETVTSDIKSNGYLRNRGIARRFFAAAGIRHNGRKIRFSKLGPDEYSIEAVSSAPNAPSGPAVQIGRVPPFQFSQCRIEAGEQIVYADDPSVTCTVYDDKHVLYNNEIYSLSALAQELRNTSAMLQGPRYFTYRGELLSELRKRLEGRD